MKRFISGSGSLGALMAICPYSTDENNENNPMYGTEFQTMVEGLDEEGCIEERGHVSEKKRRLSVDQVKELEKNFEVENKLESERKVKLAQDLGLQPRQVAVWFQNRRARWKTKQLERDYGVLKANYDGLKLKFDKLQHDNESLLRQIRELKSKLNEDGSSEEKTKLETPRDCKDNKNGESKVGVSVFGDFKDGSSDSDSSAILNDDSNNNNRIIHHGPHRFLNGSPSASCNFEFSEMGEASRAYHPQFVKMEEHNFFGGEECTTFFSYDQAPTLHWYGSDELN